MVVAPTLGYVPSCEKVNGQQAEVIDRSIKLPINQGGSDCILQYKLDVGDFMRSPYLKKRKV